MVEVEGTEEFEAWFLALTDKDAEAVARVVGLLEEKGVSLGFPHTSEIKGSQALRELRVQSGGHPLRVFSRLTRYAGPCCSSAEIKPAITGSTKPLRRGQNGYGPSTSLAWRKRRS